MLLFTGIPLQLLTVHAQGQLATGLSSVFKARLLYGALKLQPDEIRHQGIGQFLGRVLETDAIELLALGGGLTAILSLTQLLIAVGVLATGSGGWIHALLLILWVLVTLLLGWYYWRTNRAWVTAYRGMTNDLVERMVGHRTRLAQEDAATWHVEEDRDLDRYLHLSENVDRAGMLLAAIPRAWMVVGLAGIALTFVSDSPSPVRLAISLGGILLALQALTSIIAGVHNVVAVTQAWDQVGPLFNAATRREEIASVVLPAQPEFEQASRPPSPPNAGATVAPPESGDRGGRLRGRRSSPPGRSRSAIASTDTPSWIGATCKYARGIVYCSKARREAANPPWRPCSRACGRPNRGCCFCGATIGRAWARRRGGDGSRSRRSFTRTTSSPKRLPSIY